VSAYGLCCLTAALDWRDSLSWGGDGKMLLVCFQAILSTDFETTFHSKDDDVNEGQNGLLKKKERNPSSSWCTGMNTNESDAYIRVRHVLLPVGRAVTTGKKKGPPVCKGAGSLRFLCVGLMRLINYRAPCRAACCVGANAISTASDGCKFGKVFGAVLRMPDSYNLHPPHKADVPGLYAR
jgi:hypothetical protein